MGTYNDSSYVFHGFVRQRDGTIVPLPDLEGFTSASGIDNGGDAVATFAGVDGLLHGSLLSSGEVKTVD